MNNSFLKTFLAALLAVVVANFLAVIFFVSIMVVFGVALGAATSTTKPMFSNNSVLRINLEQPIVDEPSGIGLSDFDISLLKVNQKLALLDVLGAIDQAAADPQINGIYLTISPYLSPGLASCGEIRSAIERFKASGKFVYSHADFYSQGSYYLSSVADKVYINPEGTLLWKGMSARMMFFKGLLDKLELEPEVVRHGSFKSACEPFLLEKMSPENRLQTKELVETIWGQLLTEISSSRGIDSARLQQYASELAVTNASEALRLGMVDSLAYGGDITSLLAKMTGQDETPNYITLEEYVALYKRARKNYSKNHIAVVYAEGEIVDGGGGKDLIGGEDLAEKLADVRHDDAIKAVVLRVNSPGGSALAAEVIWHEMELLQQEKPLIVSMGDQAASGGYYIAAPADAILASPSTITGSIGVFGLLINAERGLKKKAGITTDAVQTNPSAEIGTPFRGVSEAERLYLQQGVDRVYTTFVQHVAEGRNLTFAQADNLAQGRVWSGVGALENGLIDGYGGLFEAISLAADRAGVADDFQIVSPSISESPLSMIFDLFSMQTRRASVLDGDIGEAFEQYGRLQRILSNGGVQALMPTDIRLE